jgi:integrase
VFKRGRIWWISVRGVRQSAKTPSREKAKWLEHKLNSEAWDREHGIINPTWEQACNNWIDNNPKTAETYDSGKYLAFWKDKVKGKRLQDITPKLIHSIITQHFKINLSEPVPQNSTANGYVDFAKRIIRYSSNLHPKFTRYPKPSGRDRWLTVDEWYTLEGSMYPDLRDIALFGLATGLREANEMCFEWGWLKDNDTWALLPASVTKTKKPYGIPLNQTAQAVIKGRREATIRHPEYVFVNRGKVWYRVALSRAINSAVKASGIAPITFHGLRHTFASWLAQRGVSEVIRDRLGCWHPRSMGDRYSHFDVDTLRPYSSLIDSTLGSQSKKIAANSAS